MTDKPKIWLSSPHMGGHEQTFIKDAFDSNWVAPLGPNVNEFEADLAAFTGAKHASVLTSGTAAIHLGLVMSGVGPGDVVMCQSFTFSATANPIRYQQAEPVFIDSEPETWNMCPAALRKGIEDQLAKGKRVKAIMPVHLYGMPAKIDAILEVAREYQIPVIEDAAEALGSHINGKMCGTFGEMGVLSFNGNKIITTSGGGAMISDDEALIRKSRYLATQAREPAAHYEHTEVGYNYRMSNITAGIGRGQMMVLEERIVQRRSMHEWYFEGLKGSWLNAKPIQHPTPNTSLDGRQAQHSTGTDTGIYFLKEPEGYFSNRWLTTVQVDPEKTGGLDREDIRLALEKENIEARPLWKPMHLQPVFKDFAYYSADDDGGFCDYLFERGLCLPSGSNTTEAEKERIAEAFSALGLWV